MPTKIVLTVDDGLTPQEVNDLQLLLVDALGEFASRRSPAEKYVQERYVRTEADGVVVHTFGEKGTATKIEQVKRRIALAKKLHNPALHVETESALPHEPTPVYTYYRTCAEDDMPAMSAALDLLPASQYGTRHGWAVRRDAETGMLLLEGPDDERAVWSDSNGQWLWLETRSQAAHL